MSRNDRDARRLVVCGICKYDRNHLYRNADGSLTVVCAGCGAEIVRSQEAATA